MLGEHGYFRLINFNEDEMEEELPEDDEVPLADVRFCCYPFSLFIVDGKY
jgi:hypothetical protein